MPGSNHRQRFQNGRRRSNLNKNNDGRGDRNRSHRVQHNAQRAMVGIAFQRMDVGYLDDRQQRQQNQAHNRGHRKASRLGPAGSVTS